MAVRQRVHSGHLDPAAVLALPIRRPASAARVRWPEIFIATGLILLLVAVLAVLWPRVVVVPLATVGVWVAAALFVRAGRLWWPSHEHSDSQESGRNGPLDAGFNRAFGVTSSPDRSRIQPQQPPRGPDPAA